MEINLEMFLRELKQYITDERADSVEHQQFVCGRLNELNNISHFIEAYQQDHELAERDLMNRFDENMKQKDADRISISETPDRESRHRERNIIVDGLHYKFRNASEMLNYFSLDDYYGNFMHLVQNKGGRQNVIQYEADALRKLLLNAKLHLDSYTAHGFDGLSHTVMFEKEEEKENA